MLQGCLRHSDLRHLLFIGLEVHSTRNCSSCSAFQPKVHLSLKAQKKFMPEKSWQKNVLVLINMQGDKGSSGFLDTKKNQDSTHRGWHFSSSQGSIKADVKRSRTWANHWKLPNNDIFWQQERYFLKGNSMAKPHFAQLLQTRHTPKLIKRGWDNDNSCL